MMPRVIEKSAEIPEGSNVGSNLYDPTKLKYALFCKNKPVLCISYARAVEEVLKPTDVSR